MADVNLLTSRLETSLHSTLGDPHLKLQLQEQNDTLYIIINRSADSALDYTSLSQTLQTQLPRTDLPNITTLQLYCRPFGQEQPDWSEQVQLPEMPPDEATITALRLQDVKELIHRTTNIPAKQIQIKEKGDALLVLFNRPDPSPLNYQAITQSVQAAIASLQLDQYSSLNLFSRAPGEKKPDWSKKLNLVAVDPPFPPSQVKPKGYSSSSSAAQTRVAPQPSRSSQEGHAAVAIASGPPSHLAEEPVAPPPPRPASTTAVADPPPVADKTQALSDFCFVSNQRLLTCNLPDPDPEVQVILKQFDDFLEVEKFAVLPVVEKLFRKPTHIPDHELTADLGSWIEEVFGLSEKRQRSAAIWLSRYCINPDNVIPILVSAPPAPGQTIDSTPAPPTTSGGLVAAAGDQARESGTVGTFDPTNDRKTIWQGSAAINSSMQLGSSSTSAGEMATGTGMAAASGGNKAVVLGGGGRNGIWIVLGGIWTVLSFLLKFLG